MHEQFVWRVGVESDFSVRLWPNNNPPKECLLVIYVPLDLGNGKKRGKNNMQKGDIGVNVLGLTKAILVWVVPSKNYIILIFFFNSY